MDLVLQYICSFVPVLVAILGEIGIIAKAISTFKSLKESNEYKAVIEQNKILIGELQVSKKLNKELLTKIDRLSRGE